MSKALRLNKQPAQNDFGLHGFLNPASNASADALRQRIGAELDRLQAFDIDDLRSRYRQLTRKAAPSHIPKWLLLRITAYRLQAKEFGDLDAESLKFLDGISRSHTAKQKAGGKGTGDGGSAPRTKASVPPVATGARFRPGTLLIREHAGEMHRVMVLAKGFEWHGTTYRSLSEVARAITGTNWNGPAFFGMRSKKPVPTNNASDRTLGGEP